MCMSMSWLSFCCTVTPRYSDVLQATNELALTPRSSRNMKEYFNPDEWSYLQKTVQPFATETIVPAHHKRRASVMVEGLSTSSMATHCLDFLLEHGQDSAQRSECNRIVQHLTLLFTESQDCSIWETEPTPPHVQRFHARLATWAKQPIHPYHNLFDGSRRGWIRCFRQEEDHVDRCMFVLMHQSSARCLGLTFLKTMVAVPISRLIRNFLVHDQVDFIFEEEDEVMM